MRDGALVIGAVESRSSAWDGPIFKAVATVVGAWPHLGRAVVGWAAVAPLLGTAVFYVVRGAVGGTKQELPQWSDEGPPK